MKTNPFAAAFFLLITLTILALSGYACHQKHRADLAEATVTQKDAELAGAKAAAAVTPKEVAALVPVAAKPLAPLIKEHKVIPLVGVKVNTTSGAITFPCPEEHTVPSLVPLPQPFERKTDTPSNDVPVTTPPITFGLHAEILLTRIPHGPINSEVSFKGNATLVEGEKRYNVDIPFDPENTDTSVAVDKNIAKAFDYYDRPWLAKHTALNCPGIGLVTNLNGDVHLGISCTYGLSWF